MERVAHRAGHNRCSYYLHIKRSGLSPTILFKYGKAIGRDFYKDIPDLLQFRADEPDIPYAGKTLTAEEAIRQSDEWKDKYYESLEKHVRLVDKSHQNEQVKPEFWIPR